MNKLKFQLLFLSIIILFSFNLDAIAEKSREELINIVKQKSSEELKEYYKKYHKRVPSQKFDIVGKSIPESIKLQRLKSDILANPAKRLPKVEELTEPPKDMVIPAEFEENQAILVYWPYLALDNKGTVYEPLFENIGLYLDMFTQEIKISEIKLVPDFNENSPFNNLMLNLINLIQEDVQAWITVANLDDTIEIKKYALDKGKEIKNAKFILAPSNSFWFRDSGPIAFYYDNLDKIGLLDLEYYSGRPLDDEINTHLSNAVNYPLLKSSIETEGGNILIDGYGNLFTSDAYYLSNMDSLGQYYIDENNEINMYEKAPLTMEEADDTLSKYMNLRRLVVLPSLQYDGGTGHIDLYADMPNENEFVFSKFPTEMRKLTDYNIVNKNIDTLINFTNIHLEKYGSKYIPVPRDDNGRFFNSDKSYQKHTRTYSNHLILNKTIIQPIFSDEKSGDIVGDSIALVDIKKAYPGYNIKTLDMRVLDGSGGSIHCITKQIPALNPIRNSHKLLNPLDLNKEDNSYPIKAKIESNKEILEAKAFFRYNSSPEWDSVVLVKNEEGVYTADMKCTSTCYEYSRVDYYITAKSEVKTISSPMTAPDGFYTINSSETSVSENYTNDLLKLYPNPSSDKLFIDISGMNNNINIKIINETGIEVYNNTINNVSNLPTISINTNKLAIGNYIVTIGNNNTSKSGKFTVIK